MIIDFLVINLVRREMAKNYSNRKRVSTVGVVSSRVGVWSVLERGVVSSLEEGVVSSWSCDIVWCHSYRGSWPPPEETCSRTSALPLALSCRE